MSEAADSELEIVGAILQKETVPLPVVRELLTGQMIDMSYGDDFTGKPGTKVYVSAEYVLKIKKEIRLDRDVGIKWVTDTLLRERQMGVYHPSKTWLLIAVDGAYSPANITVRLRPLHKLFTSESTPYSNESWQREMLLRLFEFYLAFSRKTEQRMDEGLSNFALADGDVLYYVDDDIYRWDDFGVFSQALGIYFRTLGIMANRESVTTLAEGLKKLIATIFDSEPLWPKVISEQLKHQYFPDEVADAVAAFRSALAPEPVHRHRPKGNDRYLAMMADVHGNSWAFKCVLEELRRQGIRHGIIAGDIVGYGPAPNECVELAANCGLVSIQGNHDYALARGVMGKGFSSSAQWSFDWSLDTLSEQNREWLAQLPPLFVGDDYLVVHGAPIDPSFINAYVYQMTYESNLSWMQENDVALCFHGHTHIQGAYYRDDKGADKQVSSGSLSLKERQISLVCPGSVGQPRDGAGGTQYAIYDTRDKRITFHQLQYDLSPLHRAMREQGFPEKIIRLFPAAA